MASYGAGVGFPRGLSGGRYQGYDGTIFEFTPTIGFTAKKLFEFEKSIKSFRVPLETSVREVIRPSIRENFAVGGRPKWVPLAASTVKKKGSAQINVDSGKLQRAAQQRNIWTIHRTGAFIQGGELLSRVPWALFVQAGHANRDSEVINLSNTGIGRTTTVQTFYGGRTPARPYLMIQAEDAVKIREIFSAWVESRIQAKWVH